MKPAIRLLLTWLLVVLPSHVQSLASDEAAAPVSTLVADPATITVARFDRNAVVNVSVIARATGAADLPADVRLSFTASPGLEVKIGDRAVAAGDIVWPVSVRVTGDPVDAGGVDFRLAYATAAAAPGRDAAATPPARAAPATPAIATPPPSAASTPAIAPAAPAAPTIRLQRVRLAVTVLPGREASPTADADVSIKTDFTNITYGVPGKAYLLVKNKSSYPFTVDKPAIASPDFVAVTVAPSLADRTSVPPHEMLRVPLDISVAARAKSRVGEWLILASVTLRRGEGAGERTGTAVVEQKVTVGVPGVSDVLQALNLPSLLLVPGALVLATWSLLLGAADAARFKWLEWKTTSFWVVAITISIVVFAAASMLGTNFLVAYNVGDVATLWLGCVAGGAGTFFLYRAAAEVERRAREPLTTDKPIAIMRKLSRANLRFYLEGYVRTVAEQQQQIFKLDFPAPDGKAWAVPHMLLRRLRDDQAAKDIVQQITARNDQPDDGRNALVAALERGLGQKWISLEWQTGDLSGPQPLPADQVSKASGGRTSPIAFV